MLLPNHRSYFVYITKMSNLVRRSNFVNIRFLIEISSVYPEFPLFQLNFLNFFVEWNRTASFLGFDSKSTANYCYAVGDKSPCYTYGNALSIDYMLVNSDV